jgi:hypothetical protein
MQKSWHPPILRLAGAKQPLPTPAQAITPVVRQGPCVYQRRQSASKNFGPVFRFLRNKVDIYLNNVPVPVPAGAPRPGEGVVHRGTATPLITDPFFNTRCCSSAISPSYR